MEIEPNSLSALLIEMREALSIPGWELGRTTEKSVRSLDAPIPIAKSSGEASLDSK